MMCARVACVGVCEKLAASADYQCRCRANYKGKRCELTSYCDSAPCLNGGQCAETSAGPVCVCFGFEGKGRVTVSAGGGGSYAATSAGPASVSCSRVRGKECIMHIIRLVRCAIQY